MTPASATRPRTWFLERPSRAVAPLFLLGLFLGHAAVFGDYIADDAGISLAYARNLVAGYGPVLYPGGEAVEGYSNPLWTLILALGAALRLDGADGIPLLKSLGLLFGAGTLVLAIALARGAYPDDDASFGWIAPVLLAVWTPFVFWSGAGLENALYAFLLALAAILQLREVRDPSARWWSAAALGGVALTRPEGCAFFLVFLVHRIVSVREGWRLAWWAGTFVVICAVFLAIRLAVFGDWLPNTYYAKIGERRLPDLWQYLVTPGDPGRVYLAKFVGPNILLLLAAAGGLLDRRHWRTTLLFGGIIAGTFLYALYAGGDFWPAHRFLTAALPLLVVAAQHGVSRLPRRVPHARWLAAGLLLAVIAYSSVRPSLALRQQHAEDSLISLQGRLEQGRRIRSLARQYGIEDPLYADPDIGGPTLAGLRVLDLGGLTDLHIARFGYYPPFFRDYIFDERRPHFIRTHSTWTRSTQITAYPEFQEQYVAITSRRDARGLHGEFVRRDLLRGPTGDERAPEPSFAQAVAAAKARRRYEDERARRSWIEYYSDHGMFRELVAAFEAHEAAGTLPTEPKALEDLYFGLLAAGKGSAAERIRSAAALPAAPPVTFAEAEQPVLALVARRVLRREMQYPRLQLFFDVLQAPRADYELWLHFYPRDGAEREKITSNHTPSPETSSWRKGSITHIDRPLYPDPGVYEIRAGLWEPRTQTQLCPGGKGTPCYLQLGTHRLGR